jgi:hypothetical protein
VAERLDEAARATDGVSWVCPETGSDGADKAVDEDQDDDDDGLSRVPARVG